MEVEVEVCKILIILLVFSLACNLDPTENNKIMLNNFNESCFKFNSSKQIYYYTDKMLKFSLNGNINQNDNIIYSGTIVNACVSPNSKYIIVQINELSSNNLFLIDNKGIVLKIFNYEKNKNLYWSFESIQWDEKSNNLVVIINNKMHLSEEIIYYNIKNNLEKKIKIFEVNSAYFDKNGMLYFIIKHKIYKYEINENIFINEKVKLYVNNIYSNDLDSYTYQSFDKKNKISLDYKDNICDFNYYRNNKYIATLFSFSNVYSNWKKLPGVVFEYKYFLPGERFFICKFQNCSVEFRNKILVIDTKTLKYMLSDEVKFFYNDYKYNDSNKLTQDL